METKFKIKLVIQQINMKLVMLQIETNAVNRKRIVDDMMLEETGEIHQLKRLVGLDKE